MSVYSTSALGFYSQNSSSVTKIAGEYNLFIIFLNQDYTEEDE